ncbi:hypothetical protein [Streptomyces sp. NPDC090445]|uniref:hypothetical protein n=1 Tax=Streptomyces sp. NPDC090445 TaxID=3365963 RepID=UPI003820D7D5
MHRAALTVLVGQGHQGARQPIHCMGPVLEPHPVTRGTALKTPSGAATYSVAAQAALWTCEAESPRSRNY